MRNKFAFAALAFCFLATSGAARAETVPYDWSGFYAGLNMGLGFADFEKDANITGPNESGTGITGGVQAGYNWQNGNFVYGGEIDFAFTDLSAENASLQYDQNWVMTFRGRAGYAFQDFLPYATLGLGVTQTEAELAGLGSETSSHVGLAAGLGLDYHWFDQWSSRVEYLYVSAPKLTDNIAGARVNGGSDTSYFRIGVNYNFN